jgi:hypothetical protein
MNGFRTKLEPVIKRASREPLKLSRNDEGIAAGPCY